MWLPLWTLHSGVISTYLHQSPAPGLGRIASLVVLEGQQGKADMDQVRLGLVMHCTPMWRMAHALLFPGPWALRISAGRLTSL